MLNSYSKCLATLFYNFIRNVWGFSFLYYLCCYYCHYFPVLLIVTLWRCVLILICSFLSIIAFWNGHLWRNLLCFANFRVWIFFLLIYFFLEFLYFAYMPIISVWFQHSPLTPFSIGCLYFMVVSPEDIGMQASFEATTQLVLYLLMHDHFFQFI